MPINTRLPGYAKNLNIGSEMAKYQDETSAYKNFSMLCKQIITINEQICAMRPIAFESGLMRMGRSQKVGKKVVYPKQSQADLSSWKPIGDPIID